MSSKRKVTKEQIRKERDRENKKRNRSRKLRTFRNRFFSPIADLGSAIATLLKAPFKDLKRVSKSKREIPKRKDPRNKELNREQKRRTFRNKFVSIFADLGNGLVTLLKSPFRDLKRVKKSKGEIPKQKDVRDEKHNRDQKRRTFRNKFVSTFADVSKGLNTLLKLPFKDFKKVKKSKTGKWKRYLMLPLGIFPIAIAIVGKILIAPIEFVVELFRLRFKKSLYKLPAVLAFSGLIFAYANGWWGLFSRENRIVALQTSVRKQLEDKDLDGAISTYEKLFSMGESLEPDVYLGYLKTLSDNGEDEKAAKKLKEFAPGPGPDGVQGLKEAHLMIAVQLVDEIRRGVGRDLPALKWHLEKSGDSKTRQAYVAWASYCILVEDDAEAIKNLRYAAKYDPIYFLQLAEIYGRTNQVALMERALEDARLGFERQLDQSPKNERVRLILADVLFNQRKFEDCEKLLVEGNRVSSSQAMREACANFYATEYVRFASERSFEESSEQLEKAFELAPNSRFVQRALGRLYKSTKDPVQKESIIEALKLSALSEKTSKNANFVLSVLLNYEDDIEQALKYSEKAYQSNPKSPPYNNNLAWQLAHSTNRDLDRALELAKYAVESTPNNASFRDTLGTVLFLMEEHKEAIVELEKSLIYPEYQLSAEGRVEVREKLAVCYEKLGLPEMALRQSESAAKAKEKLPQPKSN